MSGRVLWWALGAVLAVLVALLIMRQRNQMLARGERPDPPRGVQTFEVADRNHTEDRVTYPQTPPVGGDHHAQWQNCGFYSEPVRSENAVHSLEHGAVWVTYRPDLVSDEVGKLRELARRTFVLVSPWPSDLPAPIVASAWGAQMRFQSADDPDLDLFVRAFRINPGAPEPGALCSGQVGEPEA